MTKSNPTTPDTNSNPNPDPATSSQKQKPDLEPLVDPGDEPIAAETPKKQDAPRPHASPKAAKAPEPPKPANKDAEQLAELTKDLQRTRADFENFRKQTELQKSQAISMARAATVEKFLPLVDDFSRAISTYPDQLAPLEKSLKKLLSSLSLEPINTASGTEFNPDFHEAVSVADDEGDVEIILETLRSGYLYEKSVLRPAMVKVGHK